ncbi:hypothetical protein G6F46_003651 [Rhizopus delemar]|uniref:SAM domain-containing protein n=2 Tax=Rhizopus TaxID=4842 RepID=A0A9P7CTN4_9FUNG|nr:hypothetical protein G6F55_002273 [Rhizopus delemar]KAG1548122.1 hypothetical protein G6F51_003852 [Rhizopus arrhizus]KAG1502073.1 hypothetical protein G6F54_002611 [Rhizopus delemar]KAG1515010.1 hypothetical protein G6F53_003247 [Rhizopus delemar]KAG1519919.1 hypothetical protein G6F52_008153 [Rhizopus delemar]
MEHVLNWDEDKVTKWMTTIGYSIFEKQFKEQGITGDVLVHLDHESLRDLSVATVGQRMDLLKNIYQLKIQHKVPVNEWDYIPPSVLYETDWLGQNGMADYRKIEAAFQERDARIKRLTEDMGRMTNDISLLKEEVNQLKQNKKSHKHNPLSKTDITEEKKLINDGGAIKVYGDKISKLEQEIESSKNVRLLLDDPASKVISSALKKYNVASDWQQYALWIKYGTPDNIQERALGYDERPLRISQKLKDAKQNPVFVLKNVKDNKPFTPPTSYTNPRAPPPAHHQQDTKSSKTSNNNNNNITSGRVGYEVVVPVISSSISSPTASTPTITHHSNGSTSSLSTNNKKNNNNGGSSGNNNSNKLTATTPTIEYNNELGLDNAIVNAIFTINNSP